ncbi:hypothetical protein K461DRAFT_292591 [Myriangium duriaei CBS 260.36]|uniref:AhpC/TSA antioxidant enzyme-domain-containing protein n=1 Tax=Myriangium duriaei CBS 260.36 TaxID=1168546 RepID=A0A9P4J4D8_9PEZI|nr:hypothetical protein K461DRAFT_292591 [Myriangium duriaei CBS 260.36]
MTNHNDSDGGCGFLCLPIGRKSKPLDEKIKDDAYSEDEVDLFAEDYDDMLRSNSVVPQLQDDQFEELPTGDELEDLYKVQVVSKTREKVMFKDLTQSKDHRRHIVIFIRHFFCGNCYGYVKALTKEMPPSKLEKLRPATTVTIIGCGDPILIPQYIEQTGCPYEIYADPSRSLYRKLGFALTTAPPPEPPRYVKKYSLSFMSNLMRSFALVGKSGKLSGGPVVQVGGDLIWIDGELQHLHRMKNAGDHMEVSDLIKLLRRQERELNRREGSTMTKEDGTASKRNSFQRALSRLSSVMSM